ncbi:MAG: hypothetical protein AB7N53_09250 [Candidatus Binatia bacterium]
MRKPRCRRVAVAVVGAGLVWVIGVSTAAAGPRLATELPSGDAPTATAPHFTLLDPSLMLPPLGAEESAGVRLGSLERFAEHGGRTPDDGSSRLSALPRRFSWRLNYMRSPLSATSSSALLRTDRSTGFSRHANRDVLDLGVTWRLGGNRIGFDYQLQSARPGTAGGDEGLARFTPGSGQATHAFTLGVTRPFGGSAPPPPPAPLLPLAPVPEPEDSESPAAHLAASESATANAAAAEPPAAAAESRQ